MTGIIKMLDRKNLQKARIEEEQYWDKILPFVQDNPHVAIVMDNKIYNPKTVKRSPNNIKLVAN